MNKLQLKRINYNINHERRDENPIKKRKVMEMNQTIRSDPQRLWTRLNTIGGIGADPKGGVSRFAWEPAYKEAMELLRRWSEEEGLAYRVDTVGNQFVRLEGQEPGAPAVLSGSHFDTVPQGGYFDGMAGVMGALEALSAIKRSGLVPRRPLELVAFINEEASQFLGGTFGSKAMCGMLPKDYAYQLRHRQTGQLLSDAMREFGMGLDPDNLEGSVIDPARYYAFVELHIEQGRYLLEKGLPISVVSSVAGIKQFYITLRGVAAHAGGMAMKDRHDAMAAAAAVAAEVERLALATSLDTRGTVGYIEAHPGEHNIIADRCVVPVDFREADDGNWARLYTDLMAFTQAQCERRGLEWSVHTTCDLAPAHCAPELMALMDDSAGRWGIPHDHMVSFPAHDSMNLSRIMPMGMIFLRSANGGVSHCPEEFTMKDDLAAGTQVLTDTLYRAACDDLFGEGGGSV